MQREKFHSISNGFGFLLLSNVSISIPKKWDDIKIQFLDLTSKSNNYLSLNYLRNLQKQNSPTSIETNAWKQITLTYLTIL